MRRDTHGTQRQSGPEQYQTPRYTLRKVQMLSLRRRRCYVTVYNYQMCRVTATIRVIDKTADYTLHFGNQVTRLFRYFAASFVIHFLLYSRGT